MTKKINAIVFSFIGIGGSLALKSSGLITEPSFLSLMVLSVLIGLFISYSDKVHSINLLKGELILKDIKETENSVNELAKAILEVTETSSHSLMLESYDSEANNKAVEKLRKLTT